MEPAEQEMTLRDYWQVVVRRKWIVITAVVAALVGALTLSVLQEPIYSAEAQMLVEPRAGETVFEDDPALAVQNLERAIETEIQVLEGQRVRSRVQQVLGLDDEPPAVSASPVGSTDVVSVNVRSADPETAQILADAYIDAYIATRREQTVVDLTAVSGELEQKVAELDEQLAAIDQQVADAPEEERGAVAAALSGQRTAIVNQQSTFSTKLDELQVDAALASGGASVVKSAELPSDPVEPTPARTGVLALAVGLLLGLGAAFLVDHLDDAIATTEDIEAVTASPVLATVPVHPPPDNRPIALSEPADHAVEIYRGLRTNVQFLGLDRPMRILQVTSSLPGEGKTTTASNLAVVLAEAGHQVVLVDADLRKSRLHEVFSVNRRPGLTDLLMGDPIDLAVTDLADGLHVIASGNVPANLSEMLASDRTAKLLEELSARYEYVILDSAPILPVADSLALAAAVDGVLFVTQARRASQRNLADALERLQRVSQPPIGMILNQAKTRRHGSGAYGYGYGYDYDMPQPSGVPGTDGSRTTGLASRLARRARSGPR